MIMITAHSLMILFFVLISVQLSTPIARCFNPQICGIKTGYYVQETNQTFIPYREDSSFEVCVSIRGEESIFCLPVFEGYLRIPKFLSGRLDLTSVSSSGVFSSGPYYIQKVEKVPRSLGRSEIAIHPYGTIAWTTTLLNISLLPNDPLIRERSRTMLNLLGAKELVVESSMTDLLIQVEGDSIEPGTYFLETSLEFPYEKPDRLPSFVDYGFVEYVLSPEDINRNQRSYDPTDQFLSAFTQDQSTNAPDAHLCIWGSDTLDGQKNIWLQQMAHMDKRQFRISYVLALGVQELDLNNLDVEGNVVYGHLDGEFLALLKNGMAMRVSEFEHIRLVRSPFDHLSLDPQQFVEIPDDGVPLADIWDGTTISCLKYILNRFEAVNYRVEHVTPGWCRNYISLALKEISNLDCDISIYGNNRGYNNDALLVTFSRVLGVPTVGELLNLFMEIVPDYIVGPSHYSIDHPTVRKRGDSTKAFVIPPGVNLNLFRYQDNRIIDKFPPVMVIAFLGRLSIEKNPGLFILAADLILQKCPFCRFQVIGDGLIRHSLEDLTRRLGIDWAMKFLGWQSSHQLPEILSKIDIVINPSLRAWSETFCISNIEVMAMKIPLVTFAVGGIGEYVEIPRKNESLKYQLGPNAVVMNEATPEAVSLAVLHLVSNSTLRKQIGDAGFETVSSRFRLEQQMLRYERLYSSIMERKKRHTRSMKEIKDY